MKKVVCFVVLGTIIIFSCTAQSSSNEAQRLVGTWVGTNEGISFTIVFNANGTGTFSASFLEERRLPLPQGMLNGNINWGLSPSGLLGGKIEFPQIPDNITDQNIRRTIIEYHREFSRLFIDADGHYYLSPDGKDDIRWFSISKTIEYVSIIMIAVS